MDLDDDRYRLELMEETVAQYAKEAKALATQVARLTEALWQFDYNPGGEGRGYFCAGCDLDGDDRETAPEERHDDECRMARAALAPPRGDE